MTTPGSPASSFDGQRTDRVTSGAREAAATAALLPGRTGHQKWPLSSTLATDASPPFRDVAEALMESMRTNRVPGTALAILADGREEHAEFGVASANTLTPVGPGTLFQIGSLTKTYTATAVWRLIDQGALALDAPVRTYIPDLRLGDEETAARVTVGNLLDHTAGWYGDDMSYTGEGEDGIARYVDERLPKLPQLFPLGRFFSYNNAAFVLLGRLIEVASGVVYNTAMQNLLLGPLGLADTVLERSEILRREYSDGHYAGPINGTDSVAVQSPLWMPRSVDPAGGIWSTTRDVIRYARMHLAAGTTRAEGVVSPESLRRMQDPVMGVDGLNLSIGRNWFVQDVGAVRAIMHNGDTGGQHTVFVAIPDRQFALVLFVNNVFGGVPVEFDVLDKALASYPGLAESAGKLGFSRALLPPPDAATVALPEGEVADYAGSYTDPGKVLTLTQSDGGLTMTAQLQHTDNSWEPAIGPPPPPPATVTFLTKDTALRDGMRIPFVRDDAGRVGWMSAGLRLVPRAAES